MTVYHGSSLEVRTPNISYSKKFLDFGSGFYVTIFKEQAEKWALRKTMKSTKKAIVSVYKLSSLSNHKVLSLDFLGN